jgi:hypothetical protein
MNERSIKICPTYFEFLLRDDTESPAKKSMCCDAIELHSPSDSPFCKLFMNIHFKNPKLGQVFKIKLDCARANSKRGEVDHKRALRVEGRRGLAAD